MNTVANVEVIFTECVVSWARQLQSFMEGDRERSEINKSNGPVWINEIRIHKQKFL